ncbi:MAG: exonuclease subunit SbcD, partial [Marinobacterium sp.]|nr:exonuclease subunit SbcD [Marinobacterium sp.]
MRILHSSDWHLGQHFMGKSREAEHRAFLDWLLEQIKTQRIDVLLVAGDIFDTGTPPSYARTLYNNFIVELRSNKCQLVILGGNHDSVATLHESRELLACLGTRVIGGISEAPADQVLLLKDRRNQPGALLCAIPFLRTRELLQSQAGQSATERQQAMLMAMQQHYQAIYDEAVRQREALELPNLPIIATGHLTT